MAKQTLGVDAPEDDALPTAGKTTVGETGAAPATGKPIDRVELAIDYAIIEHFSKHLYGSPNKAVEELVANSFDAFAYRAYVYIPGGGQVEQRVVVWDDGDSMDVEALKKLWWIARSPKNDGTGRERTEGGRTRRLIGKFGIGKLASYAIGRRITHICKRDGRYLLVSVDYGQIEAEMADKEPGSATYTSAIFELDEKQAIEWIDSWFAGEAEARKEFLAKPAFTVAVVDQLRDVSLTPGRLGWVLGNGMPLRPDFEVYVNDKKVAPGLGQHATTSWDLSEPKLAQSIQNAWNEAKAAQPPPLVEGDFAAADQPDVSPSGEARPVLVFPKLGRVSAEVMLFENSLHRAGESRDERSYGFFVMVRDRLLNVEDAELFLSPPSYGTFYRAQFVIRADRLDEDLLADRERVVQNPRSRELTVIQQGLYRAARAEIERQDDERAEEEKFVNLLPVSSRSLFRDPVVALLVRDGDDGLAEFDFAEPKVVREDLSVDDPVVVLDPATSQFQVNAAHPFIRTLREQLGNSKAALRAMRAIETLAIAERLLEGYLLYEMGLTAEQAAKVASWREDLLRSLAVRYSSSPDEVKAEVRNASYKGKARFENALAALFSHMGYVAERRGAAGDEDVLVIGPTGENETRFIVEGKGSSKKVANDAAELASAKSHAKNAAASVALVVAREFVGFELKEEPALLQEARAVSDEGPDGITVSPVDVESLLALHDAVDKYAYPLATILPVLAIVESPADKLARISQLESPIEHFDFRGVLDLIWDEQQGDAAGDWVPYRSIWQKHYKDGGLSLEDFQIKLAALDALAGGLITLQPNRELVLLRQSPEKVAEHVQRGIG